MTTLSNQHEQETESFRSFIRPWKNVYTCSVHSYVGLKTKDGPFLLSGRVILESSRDGINETRFKFETENVFAGRFVNAIGAQDIDALIEKAKSGSITGLQGEDFVLAREESGSLWTHFAPIHHPFISEGPRLPSLLIRGRSRQKLQILAVDARQLDWELRAADMPFDSLDELLGYCALPTSTQSGDPTLLDVIATSPALIAGTSKIVECEAVVECRVAQEVDPAKLRLGWKIFRKNQEVERGSATGDVFQWSKDKDFKVVSHKIAVGDAMVVQAFLSIERISLHQWWLTDPQKHLNARHAIHQIFDPELDLLKEMLLRPKDNKPYAFEGAVSTLLTLLGFSVANYGRIPKLQKGPDIIALTPAGHVLVLECTIGLLNENDKLAKLVHRTKLVRENLVKAGFNYLQIQAAIVTPLSKGEVEADLAAAGTHGIAVICKQEIELALNQIGLPPNAENTFQNIKKLIPGSENPSLFPR